MSREVIITAIDQDGMKTALGYVESHDENLCESSYVLDPDDIPAGTVCIEVRIIP